MGRNRTAVVVISLVVLVVVLVVGVRLATRGGSGTADPAPADGTSGSPTPLPSSAQTTGVVVPAYFLGESAAGQRLFRTEQRYEVPAEDADAPEARAQAAVQGVVSGDSDDSARTSAFPEGTTARVTRDGDDVTVDLSGADLTGDTGADTGTLALQSVVWTVDAVLDDDVPVAFTVDGEPAGTILGADASQPVAKGDDLSTLGLVQVESPGLAAVSSPFTVSGRAAANEATLTWRLESQDGSVVQRGSATTQECCTFSPYSFTVRAPAGRYTLTVSDGDDSGGSEGGGSTSDSRTVTVR